MTNQSKAMQWFIAKTLAKNKGWHKSGDGLGIRRVLLDGVEIKHVIRCHELRGKAVLTDSPIKIDKHRKIMTHVVRGDLRVEFL